MWQGWRGSFAKEDITLRNKALRLLSMLEGSVDKGKERPKISGPQKDGRGCVVGAGLEKTFRVGGKCEDIDHGGVPNPQGGVFAVASYFENFIPLAEKYGVGEVVKIPRMTVWAKNSATETASKLSTTDFVVGTLREITNSSAPDVNLGHLFEVCHF